jgi:hypothetical protein
MENSTFVYVKTVKFLQVFPTLYLIEIFLFSFFQSGRRFVLDWLMCRYFFLCFV